MNENLILAIKRVVCEIDWKKILYSLNGIKDTNQLEIHQKINTTLNNEYIKRLKEAKIQIANLKREFKNDKLVPSLFKISEDNDNFKDTILQFSDKTQLQFEYLLDDNQDKATFILYNNELVLQVDYYCEFEVEYEDFWNTFNQWKEVWIEEFFNRLSEINYASLNELCNALNEKFKDINVKFSNDLSQIAIKSTHQVEYETFNEITQYSSNESSANNSFLLITFHQK